MSFKQRLINYWALREKTNLPRLLERVIAAFLLVIPLFACGQTSPFSADYSQMNIKVIPEETKIDWSKNTCNPEAISDLISHKKVILNCKSVFNEQVFDTYLMDTNNKKLLLKGFTPTRILRSGKQYYSVLYSEDEASYIFMEINEVGLFGRSYLIDGEPLSNVTKTNLIPAHSSLAYPGLLVWFSPKIISTPCLQDVSKLVNRVQSPSDSLYMHVPIQIRVLPLGDHSKNPRENPDQVVRKLIEETVNNVLLREDKDISFGEQLFVFLATNSPDKNTLKYLVNKYKTQINSRMFDAYKASLACR